MPQVYWFSTLIERVTSTALGRLISSAVAGRAKWLGALVLAVVALFFLVVTGSKISNAIEEFFHKSEPTLEQREAQLAVVTGELNQAKQTALKAEQAQESTRQADVRAIEERVTIQRKTQKAKEKLQKDLQALEESAGDVSGLGLELSASQLAATRHELVINAIWSHFCDTVDSTDPSCNQNTQGAPS